MQERFLNNYIIGRTLLMETKNKSEYLVNRFYYYVARFSKLIIISLKVCWKDTFPARLLLIEKISSSAVKPVIKYLDLNYFMHIPLFTFSARLI